MSHPRPRVLIDCDPGHDDAFALLYAARTCEVVALTSVSGNVGLASTTRNALRIRDLMGVDVPVHRGAAGPLVGEPLHAPDIHGESGLDGPSPRAPRGELEALPAAQAIVEASKRHDDLWIVALGPLTNVALALRLDPGLAERLAGISLMGGSRTCGNTTAAAEFNILADPEAADVVFTSGANLVMAGLDLTHQWRLDEDVVASLRDLGSEAGTFTAELLSYFLDMYARHSGHRDAPMHDPCAVMALSDPQLFDSERLHVAVELRGERTRGMTLCDQRDLHRRQDANSRVLTRIDAAAATRRLVSVLAEYPAAG